MERQESLSSSGGRPDERGSGEKVVTRATFVGEQQQRAWWTRENPLVEIWGTTSSCARLGQEKGEFQATGLLVWLQEKVSGKWRWVVSDAATPDPRLALCTACRRRCSFEHVPGCESAFDFTNCDELGVTIADQVFMHLLFEFVLTYSDWKWTCIALARRIEAMARRSRERGISGLKTEPRSTATCSSSVTPGGALNSRRSRPSSRT